MKIYLSKDNKKLYIKPQNYEKTKSWKFKNDISKIENRTYNAEDNYYIYFYCKKLIPVSNKIKLSKSGYLSVVTIYESEGCRSCTYKNKYTKVKENKRLYVSKKFIAKRQNSLDNIFTEKGTKLRMNRSVQIEGAFGVLKQDYGVGRYSVRVKKNIRIELNLLY